jgi:hypothetical protein
MSGDYTIHERAGGCTIELRGVVVAITTGDGRVARTLIGHADFRAEVEAWLAGFRAEGD